MKTTVISFVALLIPLLAIDGVWLTFMSKRFYAPQIGHLMASNPKLVPAILFYVLYAIGLTFLIVLPSIEGGYGLLKVFALGALLGVVAYGAYDLTNHATLKDWPLIVTVIDMIWGGLLTGTVATIATYITRYLS